MVEMMAFRLLLAAVLVVTSTALTNTTSPPGWAFQPASVAAAHGRGGMVSSTDRVASEIGVEVLRRGGNAIDAAIATHFALAVVNPEAGNIGGGGFLVARMGGRENVALDFRERAPQAATRDMYLDAAGRLTDRSRVGHLAAAVPGSVAGMWHAHQRYGVRPWAELVQPAINLADGIVVHERLGDSLRRHDQELRRYPSTMAVFVPEGRSLRVSDRLVQRDLAETLRRIARDGADGFYRGRTADLIAEEMQRGGGLITHEDLAGYTAVWREPLLFGYRGHSIVAMPPPSSGGVAIAEILNILAGYDLRSLGHLSVGHAHLFAEAAKRAFIDRNVYLADPDFVPSPVGRLMSRDYADERRASIALERATPAAQVAPGLGPAAPAPRPTREGEHTTHYSIVDGQGNAVAVTTTINSLYGNLVTVSGAGFLLNNEMDDFAARPGSPNQYGIVQGEGNAIESGKRMLSSMAPTIVLDPAGRVKLVTGSPGGPTIISTVAQLIVNIVDFSMDAVAATAAPRLHHQHLPDVLYYEHDGLAQDVANALRARGHFLSERSGYQGDTQSVFIGSDGMMVGVADPRRGGAAVSAAEARPTVQ